MDEAKTELKESLEALREAGGDVVEDVDMFLDALVAEVKSALEKLGQETPEWPTPVRDAADVLKRILEDLKTE